MDRINHGCINCTVVELKLASSAKSNLSVLSINCTVVELKQNFGNLFLYLQIVLIVPLWN